MFCDYFTIFPLFFLSFHEKKMFEKKDNDTNNLIPEYQVQQSVVLTNKLGAICENS